MKKFLKIMLIAAVLLSLTACGESSSPEEDLAACRAVMDDLQSRDSYHIFTRREFVQDKFYIEFDHWKNGDDWLDTHQNSTEINHWATMRKDGLIFDNSRNIGESRADDIKWSPYLYHPEQVKEIQPWIADCHWEDQQVQVLSTARSFGGRVVTLQFLSPYTLWNYVSEIYTVDFHFDGRGNFEKAVMTAVFTNEEGEEERWIDEMTILSTDPSEIAARIDQEYQRALAQNQ